MMKAKNKDVLLAILKEAVALRSMCEPVAYSWWGTRTFTQEDVEGVRARLNDLSESVPEVRPHVARIFVAFDSLVAAANEHPLQKGCDEDELFTDKNPLHSIFKTISDCVAALEIEVKRRL